MRCFRFLPFSLLALLVVMVPVSSAHELILAPQQWSTYTSGQKLPFSVASAHVFIKSVELEKPELVEATYAGQTLELTANQAYQTYDGVAELKGPGCAIITAHRKGAVWSKTTQGMQPGGRDTLKGVIEARLYEKFCKTLLPVDGDSSGYDAKLGHPLEIVPVDDPLSARAGETVAFQVLHDGQPVAAEVTATYDGYSDADNTYAYFAEADDNGVVRVGLHSPGLWMVRVQHVASAPDGANYDKHYLRAVLVFPVRR